jgi:hypothetical protein
VIFEDPKIDWSHLTPDETEFLRRFRDMNIAEALLERLTQRNELRAILAPLLDDPIDANECHDESWYVCRFCGKEAEVVEVHPRVYACDHAPDCPVLRKDELLGRPTP